MPGQRKIPGNDTRIAPRAEIAKLPVSNPDYHSSIDNNFIAVERYMKCVKTGSAKFHQQSLTVDGT